MPEHIGPKRKKARTSEPERRLDFVHAESALITGGWTQGVRLAIEAGRIAAIETGVPPRAGDERHAILVPGSRQPAQPRLSARAWRVLPRRAGRRRHVLDLARDDVPFRADDDARRRRGDRRSALCRDAGGGLRRRRRISLSASRAGRRALRRPGGNGGADRRRGARSGHRPDAAAGVLRTRGLRRRPAEAGAAPVRQRCRLLRRASRGLPRGRGDSPTMRLGVAPHCLRAATPRNSPMSSRSRPTGRSISMPPSRPGRSRTASRGPARVRSRWLLDHAGVDRRWCLVHATHMDDAETRDARARRARSRDSARSPRPISATAFSDARYFSTRTALRRRAPIPTSRSAPRASCGSSNMPSGFMRGRATSGAAPAGRPAGRCSRPRWSAGRRRSARRSGRLAPGAIADFLTLTAIIRRSPASADDAILDAWIFSAGTRLSTASGAADARSCEAAGMARARRSRRGSPRL